MGKVEKKQEDVGGYPSPKKRIVIMAALYLSVFLVTLDQNIISTAIPRITDDFDSLDDIGWYGSAYLLTTCSFQLLMGRIYTFYPAKPVFLINIAFFEIGSAICGAAPNSDAFIIGRAVAGLGSSGIFSGLMVMMVYTIPLRQRPIYQGLFGAVFAIGSVVGPLLGGTFTDKVSWRWCFYINLPIGAVTVFVVFLILHLPNQKLNKQASGWLAQIKRLDPIGNLVFFPGVVCLILALQWGGTKYSWSNARIIVLLILSVVLVASFIVIQIWKQDSGTVPPRVVKIRSIAGAMWFGFFNGGSMMMMLYYLPVYFQAIKGDTAVESGIALLPLILSTVVGSLTSGAIVSKVGYTPPFFILSSVLMPVGAGLISTFTPTTSRGAWIGYQILFGIALGFGSQQPMTVVQTVLKREDVATGSAIIFFIRFLGGAIFLPVAQNLFLNKLVQNLANLPDISPAVVTNTGATALRNLVSSTDLDTLLLDYNAAIVAIFYMVTATSAATIFGSLLIEWKSLKTAADEADREAKSKAEATKETMTEASV